MRWDSYLVNSEIQSSFFLRWMHYTSLVIRFFLNASVSASKMLSIVSGYSLPAGWRTWKITVFLPINNTEEVVEKSEDDELSVEQFIDAALPSQKQVKEGPQTCISNPARVRYCHCCCSLSNLLGDCVVTWRKPVWCCSLCSVWAQRQ